MDLPKTHKKHRAGGFIVEAVVSSVLLATASVGLIQLARSSAELRHRADRELAAFLTAANVLERLRPISSDELPERIDAVEQECARSSGCAVTITSRPFDAQGVAGIHLRVDVVAEDHVQLALHDWRMKQVSPPEEEGAEDAPPSGPDEEATARGGSS